MFSTRMGHFRNWPSALNLLVVLIVAAVTFTSGIYRYQGLGTMVTYVDELIPLAQGRVAPVTSDIQLNPNPLLYGIEISNHPESSYAPGLFILADHS